MRKRLQSMKRLAKVGTAAALASGMLFALSGPLAAPTHAASAEAVSDKNASAADWGAFEVFREAVDGKDVFSVKDSIVIAALDQGYVETLDDSVSGAGYTFNVKGVVRDSRSLTLLYTLTGEKALEAGLSQFSIKNGDQDLIDWQGLAHSVVIDGTVYGYASFRLKASDSPVGTFSVTAPVYNRTLNTGYDPDSKLLTTLKLNVQSDPTRFARHESRLATGQTFTVDGQRLTVTEAYVTPLRSYVKLTADESNSKEIFRLTRANLTLSKNGVEQTSRPQLGTSYRDGSDYIFQFPNESLLTDPDGIVFHADGIEALGKDELKLVVDTKKNKVISSAIPGIEATVEDVSKDVSKLTLKYPVDPKNYEDPQELTSLLSLSFGFADASGKLHEQIEAPDGSGYGHSYAYGGSDEGAVILYFKKGDYPQPLTLDIEAYPNLIGEAQDIVLK